MYSLNTDSTCTKGNCKATLLTSIGGVNTFELVYPRIIHGEFMTHRMMSRNASSSRATPIDTMIKEVLEHPYIPKEWPKNCKGMVAQENETDPSTINSIISNWLFARDMAVSSAKMLKLYSVHKEIVNRVLEPFQYIKVIATSYDWDHFIELRDTTQAQPDIRDLALAINDCLLDVDPYYETYNFAHGKLTLPYVEGELVYESSYSIDDVALISAARCARVSYLKHDGTPTDPQADLELGKRLIRDGHMTPFEHIVYTNDSIEGSFCYYGAIANAVSYRTLIETKIKLNDFASNPEGATCKLFKGVS